MDITTASQRPAHLLVIHVIPGTQGLSKMKRNHIHLAQGVAGESVISGMSFSFFLFFNQPNLFFKGMRTSSQGTRRGHQVFLVR